MPMNRFIVAIVIIGEDYLLESKYLQIAMAIIIAIALRIAVANIVVVITAAELAARIASITIIVEAIGL